MGEARSEKARERLQALSTKGPSAHLLIGTCVFQGDGRD